MEELLKKIYNRIRSNQDIYSETDLSFDEIINKYYNILDEKLPKNHICILREVINNDKEFYKVIEYYRNFSKESKIIDFNTPCENCSLKCCNNIDPTFNFFSALFIMDLWIRKSVYNAEINGKLIVLFFKQFYIEENLVKFNEERMINLFIDYDLEILEKALLENDSLTNIKRLIEVKEVMLSLETRFNNLNDKKLEFINQHKLFINRKLEYFEKKYSIEKESQEREQKKINEKLRPLDDLWLPNAKISLKDLIKIGVKNKIWDKHYNIITERNTLYGTSKSLLASLSVALINNCYPDTIHYKILGKAFCEVFNIEINPNTKEPYKSFNKANPKITKEFKRLLKI